MDSGWTPGGGKAKKSSGGKDTLDDLLGDLLDDDVPPKKKPTPANNTRQQFGSKKQSSKDEDFYSSLAMAAEDDNLSDVSEADVNQMAKSIADLDDLDADLFPVGGKPKRGSLKDKAGKGGTPRRTGTPRSRGSTPRAGSPPLRLTSPANRVISPQRNAGSPTRSTGTPPGRDTPTTPSGIDNNRQGSGSKKGQLKKPTTPTSDITPEYRPTTAPGKLTDLSDRPSVTLKPGDEQERPRTVPKTKSIDFGEFDADDPLAGIPLSDEEEEFGLPRKKQALKTQQPAAQQKPQENLSPRTEMKGPKQDSPRHKSLFDRPPTRSGSGKSETPEKELGMVLTCLPGKAVENIETKEENADSPRHKSLFDRPPTRSGSGKSEAPEKELEQAQKPAQPAPASKPALTKKKSEEALFSDDDDFLGGLGIEEKGAAPKPKAVVADIDDEDRPAKSVFDKLLGKDSSVSKHLEQKPERREFVLDAKYTKPAQEEKKVDEEDFLFGSYMPSAVASNSSRPTSRRSVRFQDDDDIFGLNDAPSKPAPTKAKDDGLDWLEMATGGPTKSQTKPEDRPAETKQPEPKVEDIKPSTAPAGKPKSSGADWLGLKSDDDDDDDDGFDYLKASSFSAPARQTQPTRGPLPADKPKVTPPTQNVGRPGQTAPKDESKGLGSQFDIQPLTNKKDDYLGLGDEIDPNTMLRSKTPSPALGLSWSKSESPSFGRTKTESPTFSRFVDTNDALKSDDIFVTGSKNKSEKSDWSEDTSNSDNSKKPVFESAARRQQMSPRMKMDSPRKKSPERKSKEPSPRSLLEQLSELPSKQKEMENGSPPKQVPYSQPVPQSTQSGPQTIPQATIQQNIPQASVTSQPAVSRQSQPSQIIQPSVQQTDTTTDLNSSTDFFSMKKKDTKPVTQNITDDGLYSNSSVPISHDAPISTGNQFMSGAGTQADYSDLMAGSLQANTQQFLLQQQQLQQQQEQLKQQQQAKQQQLMRQLQRQQQQFQKQQMMQLQQLQQTSLDPQLGLNRPFYDDMGLGLGGHFDLDAQSKIKRLEVELQYARDILTSTKVRYEEEITAIENSYKSRLQLSEETYSKREQRWREENGQLMEKHLSKIKLMEEEKSDLVSTMYKKLEETEREKGEEIERLKEIQRQALDSIKKDHEESLLRLKRSKDQQIEAAAASHETSRSFMAAVEMIRTNAKDLGDLQRKIDNWHAQGLDDREITLRAKDEQLRMLQDRLNKQQEDNDLERQRLQELITRLEAQIREQTRMLEEERWKVKQEQSRLQGLQTALEDERKSWTDHQARERSNMEKSREALLEEQKSVLGQLHKERQQLAEEQVQFNMQQKLAKEEGTQYGARVTQARAELEALTRAIAESRDRYESLKDDIRREEDRMKEERRLMEKERTKMDNKEAELMEAANMLQEKSREIEETYNEGQRKFEEGMSALTESQRLESEEAKRIDTINFQLNAMKMKEKEISEEKLRLSKEKREHEKFRNTLLCPNCRQPNRQMVNGNMNYTVPTSQNLLMTTSDYPANGVPSTLPVQNGIQQGYAPQLSPGVQLSVNTVDAVTESIKSDRSIRLWKMEALKDQKYLEEQSLFLHTLKYMPYTSPKS